MLDPKIENITDICEIGKGIFGISDAIAESNRFFVMKKLDKDVKIKESCIKLIGKPNFPTIAKYINFFPIVNPEDNPLLIIDLYTKGSLFDFISLNKAKAKGFTFFQIDEEFILAYGVSKGLEYLHSNQIIHGNLTSKNVLIDKNLRPHLDGFMYVRNRNNNNDDDYYDIEHIDSILNYTAPEILEGFKNFEKVEPTVSSDIYSFGMILYEIFTGQTPFQEFDSHELLIDKIISGLRPPTDNVYNPFVPIIESCWNQNPSKRPTAKELSTSIYEIATKLNSLKWYKSLSPLLNELTNTDVVFDGYWKPLCKASENNESHLAMYVIGNMCLNERLQNSPDQVQFGLKFILISADTFYYAMKKIIELRKNGNIGDIEGFNFEKMKEIINHYNSREEQKLSQIHYNISIK